MKSSATAAAVAASLLCFGDLLVSAAPTEKRDVFELLHEVSTLGGMTFKINQVPNKKFPGVQKGRGSMAMARAYGKFGVTPSDDLLSYIQGLLEELQGLQNPGAGNSTPDEGEGEVVATPQMFDVEYLCPVEIGTPPQTLNLDFDTGSSDLWVFSSDTPTDQVLGQAIYDVTQSSTAQQLDGESWSISYGDGSGSSGSVYSDVVSIGGVTVESQAVEAASNVSMSFTQNPDSDGLVGLAFSSINTVQPTQQKTFFDSAMPELASQLFTANLKAGEPGNYNFGFIDTTEFSGDITYVPVNTSQGFWQFTSEGFAVGDAAADVVSMPHQAIADTGTTLMLVPEAIAAAYYAQVAGAQNDASAGGFIFPCDAELPAYTAAIGDYRATVPGEFVRYAPADGATFEEATTCFGGIQPVPASFGLAIYGDVFLKSQFVVFHGGEAALGFAGKPL